MRLLFLTALASSALANNMRLLVPRELQVRQGGNSFIPDTDVVSTCASDEIECPGEFQGYTYCVDLSQGESCCSQGYSCPVESFCLIDGYCCPNGLDPATCALNNGVTLPSNFGSSSSAMASPSTETPSSTTVDRPNIPISTPVLTSETPVSSTVAPPSYVISSNTTVGPTGTGSTPGQTSVTFFTGAGSVNSVANGVAAAFGLGLVGALL